MPSFINTCTCSSIKTTVTLICLKNETTQCQIVYAVASCCFSVGSVEQSRATSVLSTSGQQRLRLQRKTGGRRPGTVWSGRPPAAWLRSEPVEAQRLLPGSVLQTHGDVTGRRMLVGLCFSVCFIIRAFNHPCRCPCIVLSGAYYRLGCFCSR